MSKKIQKSAKTRPNKKAASPTPALLAALALLSVSLRVTEGTPAEDLSATPNAGMNAAGAKLASSIKFKYTTTPKEGKTNTLAKPPVKLQSNQHKTPTSTNRNK